MMNNGTVGPMPKPVFNTLMKAFKVQATNPYDVYAYIPRKVEEVRRKVAEFINADPEEVAITRNTTEGLNFIANGLDLKEGDEVIVESEVGKTRGKACLVSGIRPDTIALGKTFGHSVTPLIKDCHWPNQEAVTPIGWHRTDSIIGCMQGQVQKIKLYKA